MRHRLVAALLLVVALFVGVAQATTTTSRIKLGGVPEIVLSLDGTSAAVDELDPGTNAHRRDAVVACVVSGQAVNLLLRFTSGPGGLFVDVVTGSTTANLQTAVGSINFSSRSHPAPTADAIDTAIMVAAVGD